MDIQALHSCFAATLDANINTRRQAELQLREVDGNPGFINGCLNIVQEPQVSIAVKTAAAVYLKNKVTYNWSPVDDQKPGKIDSDEKPVFRERLISVLVKAPAQIRPTLVAVLNIVVSNDFPSQWPDFLDRTMALFHENNVDSMRVGLICLLEIAKYYRWTTGEGRDGLHRVIDVSFPGLLSIGNTLVQENDGVAGEMLYYVLKIYKMAINHQLPPSLQSSEAVSNWGSLFLNVIRKPLPEAVLNLDTDEREMNPWVKSKKWSFANLFRLFSRYAANLQVSDRNEKYKAFSQMFIANFVPEILNIYFEQIQQWVEKKVWISKAALYNILSFLEECIQEVSTWNLIKPHFESLIAHIVFPLLCPTDEDLELFEEEPVEYIHKRIDIYEESPTPDIAATNFLLTLVRKKRKTVFGPTLQFIQTVVNEHLSNQQDLQISRKKEGALRMLGSISYIVLSKKSPIVDRMEGFISQYVFSDFSSPYGFLRARACEFINRYAATKFQDINNVSFIYQSIMKCMADEHLPVQVEAALALQPLISHDFVQSALSARIPEVMQQLLSLAEKIDIDAISGVMEEFVEVFSEQLIPFSEQLATQLRDQFMRIVGELLEKQSAVDDGAQYSDAVDDDKVMAALGILNTLTSLLLTLDNANEIVLRLEEVFLPIFSLVFNNEMSEFYTEVYGLVENCTFCLKQISPNMWQVFKLLHKTFDGFGLDYLDEMLPCLDNYIQYGSDTLGAHPEYVAMLYDIVEKVMVDPQDRLGSADRSLVCTLSAKLLLCLKGRIDDYVPRLLEVTIARLRSDKTQLKNIVYHVNLLEVIVACLYYNAHATLAFLEQKGFNEEFFSQWFGMLNKFTRVQDKKLCSVGILSIVVLPEDQIPNSIKPSLGRLTSGLVNVLQGLQAAIAHRTELAKEYENDELYDNFDDDFDDDDWDQAAADDEEDETLHENDRKAAGEYIDFLSNESSKLQNKAYGFLDEDEEAPEEELLVEHPLDPVNVYRVFRDTFVGLSHSNPARYQQLTGLLTEPEQKAMAEIAALADQ